MENEQAPCKNCGSPLALNFCPQCGQPAILHRIDGQSIVHGIQHILHLERGFFHTVIVLLRGPGKAIRHYLRENRSLLVKPFLFIILTSLIYSLAYHFFHIEEQCVEHGATGDGTAGKMLTWVQQS